MNSLIKSINLREKEDMKISLKMDELKKVKYEISSLEY